MEGHFPFDWYVRTHGGMASREALNRLGYDRLETNDPALETAAIDRAMADVARAHGVPVLSRHDLICDDAERTCKMVTDDGHKMFADQHHYTRKGAAWIGQRIWKTGWLDRIRGTAGQAPDGY